MPCLEALKKGMVEEQEEGTFFFSFPFFFSRILLPFFLSSSSPFIEGERERVESDGYSKKFWQFFWSALHSIPPPLGPPRKGKAATALASERARQRGQQWAPFLCSPTAATVTLDSDSACTHAEAVGETHTVVVVGQSLRLLANSIDSQLTVQYRRLLTVPSEYRVFIFLSFVLSIFSFPRCISFLAMAYKSCLFSSHKSR